MSLRDLALKLAVVSVVADKARETKDALRAELLSELQDAGADATGAILPDGTRVAKVSVTSPKARAVVFHEEAFTKHVSEDRPDEIVWSVRDSYKRGFLESLVETESGEAVDPRTGELVPGVRFVKSDPYPTCRFEKEGRDLVVAALRSGEVNLDLSATALPQLEAK